MDGRQRVRRSRYITCENRGLNSLENKNAGTFACGPFRNASRGQQAINHPLDRFNLTGDFAVKLTAPTNLVFLISLIIAVLGILSGIGAVSLISISAFWMVTIGYAILAVGCLLRGL